MFFQTTKTPFILYFIFLSLFSDCQIATKRFYAYTITQVLEDQSACSTNHVMQVNQSQYYSNRAACNQSPRIICQSKALRLPLINKNDNEKRSIANDAVTENWKQRSEM